MKWFFLIILVLVCNLCKNQNLVPNPSFEFFSQCPFQGGQIHFANGWFKTTNSSSDYLNACSSNFSIPLNAAGFQYANTGIAHAGIHCYAPVQPPLREYISIKLKDTLQFSSRYRISFYVSLSDYSMYGINKLGAYISILNPYVNVNNGVLDTYEPQIKNGNELIIDTVEWTKIEGLYTAIGGEEFISIGNFYRDSETDKAIINESTPYPQAYYYIDDVSIIKLPDFDLKLDSIHYTQNCSDSVIMQLSIQNKGAKAHDFTEDPTKFSTEVLLNGKAFQNYETILSDNLSNPIPGTPLAADSFMVLNIGPIDLSNYDSIYTVSIHSFFARDSNNTNDTLVFEFVPPYQEECFPLKTPNVFTPNGDGINDEFRFYNAKGKSIETEIFNRWGNKVKSWSHNEGWDGEGSPEGVYYYVMRVMEGDNWKMIRGKVTLLR